jgi:hypothetical protein
VKHIPWDIILALLAGLAVGLIYSWEISPLRVVDAEPSALRADFKDDYRAAIAAAYAADGNLPRAQVRMALLRDPDPVAVLNAQAQRMTGNSNPFQKADQVAALAVALGQTTDSVPTALATASAITSFEATSTMTPSPPPVNVPIIPTETPPAETQPIQASSTPRPTDTPLPTLGPPFALTGREEICDIKLPTGLLQIIVLNSNRRQMPAMKVMITWDDGEEQFFTGLKPELGNGYADYIMVPDIAYTVQLETGSDMATGLAAPTCQTPNGETFFGGIKLTFQQP